MTSEELKVLVRLAREYHLGSRRTRHARPGDLVIEVSKFDTDPDSIGWLVAHGQAPYERDAPIGSPTREVWDVVPLSGITTDAGPSTRWENAEFVALPESVAELAREAFPQAFANAQRAVRVSIAAATCDLCGAPFPEPSSAGGLTCIDRAACDRRLRKLSSP